MKVTQDFLTLIAKRKSQDPAKFKDWILSVKQADPTDKHHVLKQKILN